MPDQRVSGFWTEHVADWRLNYFEDAQTSGDTKQACKKEGKAASAAGKMKATKAMMRLQETIIGVNR